MAVLLPFTHINDQFKESLNEREENEREEFTFIDPRSIEEIADALTQAHYYSKEQALTQAKRDKMSPLERIICDIQKGITDAVKKANRTYTFKERNENHDPTFEQFRMMMKRMVELEMGDFVVSVKFHGYETTDFSYQSTFTRMTIYNIPLKSLDVAFSSEGPSGNKCADSIKDHYTHVGPVVFNSITFNLAK
jgi:hypothetical protein